MSSPYPQPPVPAPAPARTNGLAVASLVTGLLCLIPPLGLVLGAVALRQIKRRGERGKGLAVAGASLSLVVTLLIALGLVSGAFGKAWDGLREVRDEVASSGSAFGLRAGDCFDQPGGVVEEQEVERVKHVECDEPHDAEVSGRFRLQGSEYPGADAIEKAAEERCAKLDEDYAMDTWALPADTVSYYFHPTVESWRTLDDRTVTCALAAGSGKLTGSLRTDATTLDPGRLTFLQAVNPVEAVRYEQPEADPDTDLKANTQWAGRMEKALGAAVERLKGHTYSGAAAGPVAELGEELAKARGLWAKAATAPDADAYWERYDVAYDAAPLDLGREVRKALNLGTTPPGEQAD
ncbi:DUF4190 domain-containing protein [Streptomyces sp. MUM 203J]|uniref:DUF4190 domain-containing protein n=1 Tax=Streptomyces sp. MUM 203J TaxID=2791990 RepID=UPI001F03F6E6|nr:DUF4190 domain-containing protein [Streptomyces sp. MUM 203J]MCH0540122.1 DUF4190 domain-containing protein [Streptomyces sp. MUM 203J]